MIVQIHAACRNAMQKRLPQMGARTVYERNFGEPFATKCVPQASRQFKAARPAANDDNAMRPTPTVTSVVLHHGFAQMLEDRQ
jgi:hypothetical protein